MSATIEAVTQQVSGYWPGVDRQTADRRLRLCRARCTTARSASPASPTSSTPSKSATSWPSSRATPTPWPPGCLHDTIEDTAGQLPRTSRSTSAPRSPGLVEGVTKLAKLDFASREGGTGPQPAQDVPGHGRGPAGDRHQAGRPPAQHAHAGRARPRQAPAHRLRDAPHLRTRWPTGWGCGASSGSSRTSRSSGWSPTSTPRSPSRSG